MTNTEELLNILGEEFNNLPLQYVGNLKELLYENFENLKKSINIHKIIGFKDTTNEILEYIEKYKNKRSDCETYFKKIMDKVAKDLEYVSKKYDEISSHIYYRARISENDLTKRSDIFHLPFDADKSLEHSYRYSTKNQHFLYLGATIYTCYYECECPKTENFYVSAFDIPNNYNILRLAILPYEIRNFVEDDLFDIKNTEEKENLLLSYINILPLIMACSVKKKEENETATEPDEYIVPQAVMNWTVNMGKWKGIEYFSNAVPQHSKKNYKLYRNLVLISERDANGEKFCQRLVREIKLTKPIRIGDIELFKEYSEQDFKKNKALKPILDKGNFTYLEFVNYFDSDRNLLFTKGGGRIPDTSNSEIHYSTSGFNFFKFVLASEKKETIQNC